MTINVTMESSRFSSDLDALAIYRRLCTRYREDQLFLLESLSGPDKDRNRSAIGFEPMLSLSVTDHVMTIDSLGNAQLTGILETFGRIEQGVVDHPVPDIKEVFAVLRRLESSFVISGDHKGPFGMGWFGYFGYDTIFMIEDLEEHIPRDAALPVISLTLYQGIITLDLKAGGHCATLIHVEEAYAECGIPKVGEKPRERGSSVQSGVQVQNASMESGGSGHGFASLEEVLGLLQSDVSPGQSPESKAAQGGIGPDYPYEAHDTIDRDRFYRWFAKGKEHIAQGDVYQLQLGHEIQVDSRIPPFQVYRRLRLQDPSPYMYYFVTPQGVHVIGASPELFIGLTPDGDITLRPIAGTVGNPGEEEARQAAIRQLIGDPKERAEHLMLVDLGRNDVARCCTPESLKVDRLMTTEVYSHVIHMVSDVVGRIRPGLDKYDVFSAAFPAGTMTGTPKVRAVEIIEETEVSSRGVYAGAVGFLGFDGMVLTALCIRTASYHSGSYHLRASAGIVEDSQPESEWQETMKKMSSAYLAITGKELAHESLAR
ncbi:anthranilate synthase component I family protein [Bifidobacterium polysaccharolyticum]|uniref:anthranilate synthase component I family protein n=1 Tax=Bifidobacterium polysaccharolyticum TaxID=2750967 RepID=UPI0018DCB7AC|nr:anthranilate synthase component I family protein [Bifidobacterium polysaccharolyticum]MBI0064350.1 anthranilate synthase component I family protein [Bifidobacterium polysaccharolyticum]